MASDELSEFRESVLHRADWAVYWKLHIKPRLEEAKESLVHRTNKINAEIVEKHNPCDVDEEELVENTLLKISPKRIFHVMKNYFVDVDALQAVSCFLHIYTKNFPAIFDSFINNRQIGNPSAYGIVFETNFIEKTIVSPLAIKFSKDNERDDLYHELAMGYIINKMREVIPNFVYTMGNFSCNKPVSKNKDISGLCHIPGEYQHVVLERIMPGQSLNEFIQENSISDILNMVTQVLLAIDMAYEMLHFVHNDLHLGNILIREIGQGESQIQYHESFVRSKYIATIIDYGLASVEINGIAHIPTDFVNIIPMQFTDYVLRCNVIYDINKFLISLAISLINSGYEEYAQIIYGALGYKDDFAIFLDAVRGNAQNIILGNGKEVVNMTTYVFLHFIPYHAEKNYHGLGRKIVRYLRGNFPKEFAEFYSETSWPELPLIQRVIPSKCARYYFHGKLSDDSYIPTPSEFWTIMKYMQENIPETYLRNILINNKLSKRRREFDNIYQSIGQYDKKTISEFSSFEAENMVKKLANALDYFLLMQNTGRAMRGIMSKYAIEDTQIQNDIDQLDQYLAKYRELRELLHLLLQLFHKNKYIREVYNLYYA